MSPDVGRSLARIGGGRFLKVDDASLSRAVVLPLALPLVLLVAGTAGYRIIEGWSLFDCLYMAVITLTTVGFGEVHPLSQGGRWFTMVLALGGIFTIFFAATEVLRAWSSGQLQELLAQKRLRRLVDQLRDHVIVCGHGRMGRLVAEELARAGVPFVAIDTSEAALAGR
jgi:voltage-gated potassium channel